VNVAEFSILVFLVALLAGFLGALTGLGGGVVIVPVLTLLFGVDMRYAIGTSLIAVIATSSGAAAAYVREGYSNIRVGMFLEVATVLGALTGALISAHVPLRLLAVIFGVVLLYSAYISARKQREFLASKEPDRFATLLKLHGTLPTARGPRGYNVQGVPAGFSLMFIAGILSGLLGIGSGAVKVIAMDRAMRLPFKVSTTTSNFMIGVTAAASAGVYLHRGYIDPALTMPVMLGVLTGALAGTRVLTRVRVAPLRIVFGVVVAFLAFEMMYSGFTGKL
jgi:uncharacterized protein